ncbi:TetR/AcrR family transcriptional regulator [Saccharothrix hoggarensis]|uniref:TetR/AcrR family transcriptional regulator n=1 Tax=Saccharothrix hoggarensis TaxID=913853 RepID=A0ABW3R2R8_9PSEU
MAPSAGRSDDARLRGAATKRARSRAAIQAAAAEVFAARGWLATRVEDIARAAGVSTPTAYNHFPGGKQQLMGEVYRPLVDPLLSAADAAIRSRVDPFEAVRAHVSALAQLARRHQRLTEALVIAVGEQTAKVGRPTVPDPSDIRIIVPLTAPLTQLLEYGQLARAFRDYPPAADTSSYHTNAILLRVFSRPDETPQDTARIALSQLIPALDR